MAVIRAAKVANRSQCDPVDGFGATPASDSASRCEERKTRMMNSEHLDDYHGTNAIAFKINTRTSTI
jgi:hypothetical protein